MIEYLCHRCGYNTNKRSNLIQHLNRIKMCNPILGDISINEIKKHYNFEIKLNLKNTTKIPQNTTKIPQNTTKIPQNTIKNNQCKYCNKVLSRYDSLNRHIKICKKKQECELLIEKEEEIKQMKLEIEELKTKSVTINNTTNNINNSKNIIINNYGDENIKHIKSEDFASLLNGIYNAVPKLIEKIHFDPNYPENQNIKYTNKKMPYLKIMKNNKWQLVNKKNELFDLIDNKCYLLKEKYYKILEKNKYNITDFQRNQIEAFIDKYNEDDKRVMIDLIERTELMLLNNS